MIKRIFFLLLLSLPCYAVAPFTGTTVSNIVRGFHLDEGSGGSLTDINSGTGTAVNCGWANTHTDFTNEITQTNNADIHIHTSKGEMPVGDNPWSIGFWYKTGNGSSKFAMITDYLVSVAYMYIRSASGGHWTIAGGSVLTFSTACIQSEAWAHVIFSYHGSNVMRVYTNGVEAGVKLFSGGCGIVHWERLVIGRGDGANSWTASVDDILMRNVATTDAEALTWYNGAAATARRKAIRSSGFAGVIE